MSKCSKCGGYGNHRPNGRECLREQQHQLTEQLIAARAEIARLSRENELLVSQSAQRRDKLAIMKPRLGEVLREVKELKRENEELRQGKRVAERALELLHDADVLCYRVAECFGDCKACWYTGLSQPIVAYAIAAAEIAAQDGEVDG